MRVLLFGHREWKMPGPIKVIIAGLAEEFGPDVTFIQGAAPGADSIAQVAADALAAANPDVTSLTFPARWKQHDREGKTPVPCRCPETARYCKAAGPRRNQQMLDEGKPDVGFAFHDFIHNAKGTKDMAERLDAAGIPVYVVSRFHQSTR